MDKTNDECSSISCSSTEDEEGSVRVTLPPAAAVSPRAPLRRKEEDTTAVQRLVDYFVIVSSKSIDQPSSTSPKENARIPTEGNAGNIHMGDSPTCPIPSPLIGKMAFAPEITARYPSTDYPDNPLNPMMLHFLFPGEVVQPTIVYEMPNVRYFVLTQGNGRKVYVTCLTVMEESDRTLQRVLVDDSGDSFGNVELEHNLDQSRAIYLPKVLLLVSTWPYLAAFREYLSQLYRILSTTNVDAVPLERFVVNICQEVPAPPPGAYCVRVHILNSTIRFWAPPAKLPIAYVAVPYHVLWECLSIENVLFVWRALVLERKVILVSSQNSLLTVAAEILCSLLFPLRWSHLYVPFLPQLLTPMLEAPVPYLVGLTLDTFQYATPSIGPDVIVVDLDQNHVQGGDPMPPTPSKKYQKLQAALVANVGNVFEQCHHADEQWEEKLATMDHAFHLAYTPESSNLETVDASRMDQVQEAFLRFFVALFKNYRKYLKISDERSTFDRAGFLGENPLSFVAELCATQQFDDFVMRRMYSPGEPDLKFFDQSIDAKLNRSKLRVKKVSTPLLANAKVHKELTQLDAVTPNAENLESYAPPESARPYQHKKLPTQLHAELFCPPRPIPRMIAAEFDRQALLVSKLRSVEGGTDVHFYSGDYHPSPEVASFTVFLFVYSSLVGQEWQNYIQRQKSKPRIDIQEQPDISQEQPIADDEFPMVMCCDPCSSDAVELIDATLAYLQAGVSDAYQRLFGGPPDHLSALYAREEDAVPETEEGLVEYEQARAVALAQLEVAFETLETLLLRGLAVDPDAYMSLMQACGRCGNTKKALELIKSIKKDGYAAGNEVMSCLVSAFAHEDARDEVDLDACRSSDKPDAYSRYLKRGFDSARSNKMNDHDIYLEEPPSEDESSASSVKSTIGVLDWIYNHPIDRQTSKMKRKLQRKRKNVTGNAPVTPMVRRHFELAESLLEYVYPNLVIDTSSDSCPDCSRPLTEKEAVKGWKPCSFRDYTTQCPKCKHRFVPRFTVSTTETDFEGSQGLGTPLYCEFLSPWVLRKEFHSLIKGRNGLEEVLKPSWRTGTEIEATLFWNLIVCCRRNRLPYTFLLQGSFAENRLILPLGPDEL